MTPQELKNSILQLAIQGKLVEQRPEEGTVEEMLSCRNCRKYNVSGDERDIPDSWKWVFLPDVTRILYGFPFESNRFNENQKGRPIIRIRDVLPGKTNTYSDEICEEKYRIKQGDMLVGMDGNFQVEFWKSDDAWLNQRVCKITSDPDVLLQKYLFYYLPIVLKEINDSVSYSTVKHLSAKLLDSMLVPLPPIGEQRRIVDKIEELMPLIDRYEKAWNRLEEFNKQFPGDLQKSILQMAIQGKLVEQRPEEGTGEELYQQIQAEKQKLIREGKIKKEKPLPEIKVEEKPFDIPETWKWVCLGNIGYTQTGNTPSKAHPEYLGNDIPFITPGDIKNGIIDYNNQSLSILGKRVARIVNYGSILQVCIGGSIGKTALVKKEIAYNQQINSITPVLCNSLYIIYVLTSDFFAQRMKEKAGGTATPIINKGLWDLLPIPLPSLAEQKRIAEKVGELLQICQKICS